MKPPPLDVAAGLDRDHPVLITINQADASLWARCTSSIHPVDSISSNRRRGTFDQGPKLQPARMCR